MDCVEVMGKQYSFVENELYKKGLLRLVYNEGLEEQKIAMSLNVNTESVMQALKYCLFDKEKQLEERKISNPKKYIKFTKFYFPHFLDNIENMNDDYFKFIDEVVEKFKASKK